MPTERTRQHQAKDRSPPEDGFHDPTDPNGSANGGHRGLDQGGGRGGVERSGSTGLKAKLAAKWNRNKRTDDSDKKVAMANG